MPHVGKGMVLQVTRHQSGYVACFFPVPVMIYSCSSVRESEFGSLLSQPLHSVESACWLHTPTFCLSTHPLI